MAGKRLLDAALFTAAVVLVLPSGVAVATCANPTAPLTGSAPLVAPVTSPVTTGSVQADHIAVDAGQLMVNADHLAFTGYDVISVAAVGVGLVAVGCILLLTGRRRFRGSFVAAVGIRVVLTLGVVIGGFFVPVGPSAGASDTGSGNSSLCADVPPVAVPEVTYPALLLLLAVTTGGVALVIRRRGDQKRPI